MKKLNLILKLKVPTLNE